MYKVYVVGWKYKSLIATFEDEFDAKEYKEFLENKYKERNEKIVIEEV